MERRICNITSDGYPYYLHTNEDFVNYWKNYFLKYPLKDTDRFEIYIDFPFCRTICKFCVYGSCTIGEYKKQIPLYEERMVNLISDMRDVFPDRINNIYFGGGTPTLWSKDALRNIISSIPKYHEARTRTIEAHPIDLTDEWMDFVINDLNIKTVSIGVQSFDIESNKDQNRIPADIEKLKYAVNKLHSKGIYVNIDIVALFNYDSELGWNIFRKDLDLVADIHPDDICSSVNFRVKNYYGKSIIYRNMLKDFIDSHPEYTLEHQDSISTDIDNIINYGEEPYHLRTQEYHKFFNDCRVGILDSRPDVIKENIVMAFGGSSNHNGISRVGMKFEDIISYFSFGKKQFVHYVNKVKTGSTYSAGGNVPNIKVGTCRIDTNIDNGKNN